MMTEATLKSGDYDAVVQDAKISDVPGLFSDTMGEQAQITFELPDHSKTLTEWFYMGRNSFKEIVIALLGRPRTLENFELIELIGQKCILTINVEGAEEKPNYKIVEIKPTLASHQLQEGRPQNTVDFSTKIILNDSSGSSGPLPFSEVSQVMPAWIDKKFESVSLILDTLKKVNQALETQNELTIARTSREALVVFEFVIARIGSDWQNIADAHFHKATIYVRFADHCDPNSEADKQLNFLQAAANSIVKALSDPDFVHPNFRTLNENILQRMEKYPYSIGENLPNQGTRSLTEKLTSLDKSTRQMAIEQVLMMKNQLALQAVENAIKKLTGKTQIDYYETRGVRVSSPQQAYDQIIQIVKENGLTNNLTLVQSLIPAVSILNQDLMTALENIDVQALAIYQLLGVQMQLNILVAPKESANSTQKTEIISSPQDLHRVMPAKSEYDQDDMGDVLLAAELKQKQAQKKKIYRIIVQSFNDKVKAGKQLRSLIKVSPEKALKILDSLPLILVETSDHDKYLTWKDKISKSGSYLEFREAVIEQSVSDQISRATAIFVGRDKTSLEEKYHLVTNPNRNPQETGIKGLGKSKEASIVAKKKTKLPLRNILLVGGALLFFVLAGLIQDQTANTCFISIGALLLLAVALSFVPGIAKVIYKIDELDRELARKRNTYWTCGSCRVRLPDDFQAGNHCPKCGAILRQKSS